MTKNTSVSPKPGFSRTLLLSVSTAAMIAAGTGNAFAAEPAAEGAQSTALPEVIVTARKRDENIQNIPVAMTALSGEQLDALSVRTIEEISATTPTLAVSRGSSGSGATISLRGIGSTYTSIGIEQSVAVNVDGVYYGQGRIINEGFFDMRQVEILKGPQALFFGKNATAGVLSFTSANPGNEFEAMGRVGYEFSSKTPSIEAVVSGPVSDTFGLRLAVRAARMDGGYVENRATATTLSTLNVNTFASTVHTVPAPQVDIPAEEDLVARLTAQWKPSEEFTLTLKGAVDRYRVVNATWNNEMYNCPSGFAQVSPTEACNGDWVIQQNDVPADIAATNPLLGRHGGDLYQDYDSYSFTADADYSTETLDITAVTGFHHFENYFLGDYDFTGSANGGTWGAERSEYTAFSEEIRVQTSLDGPINFMGGVFYQNTQLDFNQQIIFPGALEDPTVSDPSLRYITLEKLSRTDGTTFAGFGQVIWALAENWEATLGARYTHETKTSTFDQPYVISLYQAAFVQNSPLNANQSFNDLSPEVTLTWKPTSGVTVYGAYKQGFKSGGFSGSALHSIFTTVDDLTFDPETAEGFEGGVRATLFDGTLRGSIDAYSYKYEDFQVDYFDATTIQFVTYNAGSVKIRGVEIQAEWAPMFAPGLVIASSLAYNKSRYDDFGGAPCWGGQRPSQGCTVVGGRPVQDLSDKPTAHAPEWTASVQANYESEPINGMVYGFTANVHGSSDYLLGPFANPFAVQDSYSVFDAAFRLRSEDERWEIALIGKNLTEEYVLSSAGDAPSSGSGTGTAGGIRSDLVGTPQPPRTVALQFTWRH
jgi:outer membrane receptor protein involved in Fe transport